MPPPGISFFWHWAEPMQNGKWLDHRLFSVPWESEYWQDLSVRISRLGKYPLRTNVIVDVETNTQSIPTILIDVSIAAFLFLKVYSKHLEHFLYYWTLKCYLYPWWHILLIGWFLFDNFSQSDMPPFFNYSYTRFDYNSSLSGIKILVVLEILYKRYWLKNE